VGPGVATFVVLLGLLLVTRLGARARSATGTGWPVPREDGAIGADVVFATRRGWLGITLDCMVAPPTGAGVCEPLAIETTVPSMCGFGALYAEALPRHLAEGGRVHLEIFATDAGEPRGRLTIGDATLVVALRPDPRLLRLLGAGTPEAAATATWGTGRRR
jgi:hypothetical protein